MVPPTITRDRPQDEQNEQDAQDPQEAQNNSKFVSGKNSRKRSPEGENTVSKENFRCKRGIALFKKYAAEIRNTAPWTYLVPSQAGKGIYLVYMKRGEESCSCPDYARYHETDEEGQETFFCKHYYAARLWKARSEECAGCRTRFIRRQMTEAGEDHLTFYADDYLCKKCVRKHGLGEAA